MFLVLLRWNQEENWRKFIRKLFVASQGALYDQMVLAKNTANALDGLWNDPETNLRVSYHLARAVADLHSIDATDATSFVHNDICCDQFLFIDGVFKLNDFNLASTQLRNQTSGLGCKNEGAYVRQDVITGQSCGLSMNDGLMLTLNLILA